MPDTPTFGRYAETPYDQMTPEQQEGYRSLVEARGPLGGPNKIWAGEGDGAVGCLFPDRLLALRA